MELEEAQSNAAEAGNAFAISEEAMERLDEELRQTRAAYHDIVNKAETDRTDSKVQDFRERDTHHFSWLFITICRLFCK